MPDSIFAADRPAPATPAFRPHPVGAASATDARGTSAMIRSPVKHPIAVALFGTQDAAVAAIDPPLRGDGRKRRAKLWELPEKHHCPVIGTCLPIVDLAKTARRHFAPHVVGDDYAMHVHAVKFAGTRNDVSETIHKHLDQKHRLCILKFERAESDAEVYALWREHYVRGEVAGALWAAVTHPALGAASEKAILAEVHMLSHQVGAGQAADLRRLSFLEQENEALNAELGEQKLRHARAEEALRQRLQQALDAETRLREQQEQAAALKTRLESFESGAVMTEIGKKLHSLQRANQQLACSARRVWALEKTLKAAHEEAQRLAQERDRLALERDALQRLLGPDDEGETQAERQRCGGGCECCEAATRRGCVLYVGGRQSLLAQYRALAERLGMQLIHHDGGVEESLSRLPELINSADAVLCPTDCVSHSAYHQLKRQCKRTGKPCLLFKGSGVSGFAAALARLSAGHTGPAAAETPPLH